MFSSTCDVTDIGCHLGWLSDELNILCVSIYGYLLDGLITLFNLIPVPDFLANMPSYTLPSGMAYYATHLELPAGIAIIISAYTLRFLVRRLPFIG